MKPLSGFCVNHPDPEEARRLNEWATSRHAEFWRDVFELLEEIDPDWRRPGESPGPEAVRYIGKLAVLAGKWQPGSGWLRNKMLPTDEEIAQRRPA